MPGPPDSPPDRIPLRRRPACRRREPHRRGWRPRQGGLHPRQRRVALLHQPRRDLVGAHARQQPLEPGHGNIGFMAVLFPEQPFDHPGAGEAIGRDPRGSLGQIQQYGIGLGQNPTVRKLHRRHLTGRVAGQEFRGPGGAGQDIGFHPTVVMLENIQHPLDLQAVTGSMIAIDCQHRTAPKNEDVTNSVSTRQ